MNLTFTNLKAAVFIEEDNGCDCGENQFIQSVVSGPNHSYRHVDIADSLISSVRLTQGIPYLLHYCPIIHDCKNYHRYKSTTVAGIDVSKFQFININKRLVERIRPHINYLAGTHNIIVVVEDNKSDLHYVEERREKSFYSYSDGNKKIKHDRYNTEDYKPERLAKAGYECPQEFDDFVARCTQSTSLGTDFKNLKQSPCREKHAADHDCYFEAKNDMFDERPNLINNDGKGIPLSCYRLIGEQDPESGHSCFDCSRVIMEKSINLKMFTEYKIYNLIPELLECDDNEFYELSNKTVKLKKELSAANKDFIGILKVHIIKLIDSYQGLLEYINKYKAPALSSVDNKRSQIACENTVSEKFDNTHACRRSEKIKSLGNYYNTSKEKEIKVKGNNTSDGYYGRDKTPKIIELPLKDKIIKALEHIKKLSDDVSSDQFMDIVKTKQLLSSDPSMIVEPVKESMEQFLQDCYVKVPTLVFDEKNEDYIFQTKHLASIFLDVDYSLSFGTLKEDEKLHAQNYQAEIKKVARLGNEINATLSDFVATIEINNSSTALPECDNDD